jgi:NlpC/P60 family putative phage cell wall peptidase
MAWRCGAFRSDAMSRQASHQITRTEIVTAARAWAGTPYHHQQSVKGVGTDCLGLIRGIWRDVYGAEPELPPPYTPDWADATGEETLLHAAGRHLLAIDLTSARPGDVLLFRYRLRLPAKHMGILIAPNRVLHATEGQPASDFHLTPWWTRRIAAAFCFPGVMT